VDLTRPYAVVTPTLDGAVLSALTGTTRPLTGREVSRLAGRRNHSGTLEVLNRLTEQGIVNRREAGSALLYTLNREHLAAPAVESLVNLRVELIRRLGDVVTAWKPLPFHASVFGSTARGDGNEASDIDLFLVRPDGVTAEQVEWSEQVDRLAGQVMRWTGNRASIAQVGLDELPRLMQEPPSIIAELRTDAITLFGPEPSRLFEDSR
jgi:predicted nucleotidyltransferase